MIQTNPANNVFQGNATRCESCRIDLMILKRADELQEEQGHA
jgi:hypothetical protein